MLKRKKNKGKDSGGGGGGKKDLLPGGIDPESPEARRVNNVEEIKFEDLKLYFLVIKIRKGIDLKAADMTLKGGNSDPFVEVIANKQKYTTKTLMKTLNPVWNEQTTFCFFDKMDEITFKVYDWDKGSKHDAIGDCTLNTSNFYSPNSNGFKGDITLTNAKRGSINVKVLGRLIVPKELEDRVNSLEAYKQNQLNTITGKENEISQLKTKNTELKNIQDIKKKDLEGFNVNFETLKMEEFGIKKECDKIRNDIKTAKDDIANADAEVQKYKDKKAKSESEKEEVQKRLQTTLSTRHSTLDRIESLRQEALH